jgi:hypothetical protein
MEPDTPLTMWEKYKAFKDGVKPWDLLDRSQPRVSDDLAGARLAVCNGCPHLIKAIQQCTQCGCFMNLKVKLALAECPLGHWSAAKPKEGA